MISINRPAIGALVLRPANGGAAIKLRLACALPALRVRLDIARQGPPGPSGGGSGSGDLTYTHPQGAASAVWVITHNLGKRPSVTVQDSAFDAVDGDVFYNDTNTLTITFSAAFSGVAYLN